MTRAAFFSYLGVFMTIIATGMGFPLPEEIPIVTAGIMSGHSEREVRWWIMLPTCILAVVIGDGFLYTIGRYGGRRLLKFAWLRKRLLPPERLEEIEDNFSKYGVKILLFARLLPGIRSPIFIAAGMMRVPLAKFLLADGIYAIPGVSLIFWLSYIATDRVLRIVEEVESYRNYAVVGVLLAVTLYLAYRFWKRPVTTGSPEDIALRATPHAHRGAHPDEKSPSEPVTMPEVKI